ncbi:hypothetical protein Tco_0671298 [Tanacetum coccineum]
MYPSHLVLIDPLKNIALKRQQYVGEFIGCYNTKPSKDECDEPYKKSPRKSCSDSFFKPCLDAQEGNGIYNFEESNLHFPQIPIPAKVNFGNPNELCKTEEFTIVFFVMAISVISISSDSSEDSVGTPARRVILFGTIPTTIHDTTPVITPPVTQTDTPVIPTKTPIIAPTIPPSPDYTPASPDYSPASDSESGLSEDPSSDHIPPLPAMSPFLSSDDDTTDSDTPDTLPSPTHGTPFTEITASTQRSPIIPPHRVMILSP